MALHHEAAGVVQTEAASGAGNLLITETAHRGSYLAAVRAHVGEEAYGSSVVTTLATRRFRLPAAELRAEEA